MLCQVSQQFDEFARSQNADEGYTYGGSGVGDDLSVWFVVVLALFIRLFVGAHCQELHSHQH